MIDLIYCAGGNARLSKIASTEGWLLGFRSDKTMQEGVISFVDIDYKYPNFDKHLDAVKRTRPQYATVPDLSQQTVCVQDITRALRQVEQVAAYCTIPLVVPKLSGQLALLPMSVAIGYSVPSHYGGAQYPLWELAGRRVHMLGGSPRKQWQAYLHLSAIAEVMSADSNYAQKMATCHAEYWQRGKWVKHPQVSQHERDLYLECWQWSCRNIRQQWLSLVAHMTTMEVSA